LAAAAFEGHLEIAKEMHTQFNRVTNGVSAGDFCLDAGSNFMPG